MCGFIAQLVEQCTGNAEVIGSNPVEAVIFFRLLLSSCLNWKIYCDDHFHFHVLLFLSLVKFKSSFAFVTSQLVASCQLGFLSCYALDVPFVS